MSIGLSSVQRVHAAIEQSEFLRAVRHCQGDGGIQFALGSAKLRPLSDGEISQLRNLGNRADDWTKVQVAAGFDASRVHHCSFHGNVTLGAFTKTVAVDGARLPAGLWKSTICDSVVGSDTLVRDVSLLANYVVASEAVLMNCGYVGCDGTTAFGNATELCIGVETGGREVVVFADIGLDTAVEVATSRSDRQALEEYNLAVASYASQASSQRGIIESGARVRNANKVRNTFVGTHANIDGAELVDECTLLSSEEEPTSVESGSCLCQSIVQWGSFVSKVALIDRCVLLEHSHVERQGKVFESILGPNTGVAKGEVSACLLGPFVGFHHQALLLSAVWPQGKGNIAYGANVGSNHTAKLPDQEIFPGEGMFFGLGANIKFPADFSRAPYCIIASSVDTLPQKVTFPFSLINTPSAMHAGLSPALNEIVPAWLLTDNMFSVKRSEDKYKSRNQARRTNLELDALRPATIDLMLDASRRLSSVAAKKDVYTEQDIAGLGKNFMTEDHRQPAIDAYRFYIKQYALLGLVVAAEAVGDGLSIRQLMDGPAEPLWEHQRRTLRDSLGDEDVIEALQELPKMLEKTAQDVERSKAKDDRRGVRIMDDYDQVHPAAVDDKFVKKHWEHTRRTVDQVEKLLFRWKSS